MENILLVFGGESYEHDISVVTASQIYNKTCFDDIKLLPFYISRDNKFYIYNAKEFCISDFSIDKFKQNKKKFREVTILPNENEIVFLKTKFGLKEYLKVSYAIFACHGGNGENGNLVAIFENSGIYSSAGSIDSLAICMNKFLFKKYMLGNKIPVVSGFKLTKKDYLDKENLSKKINKLGFPLVVKPNNGGSSIGLFIVKSPEELDEKILDAFEFDNEILVEKFISNTREFNVAILGDNEDYVISEIDEPLKEKEVLTFSDKYLSSGGAKCNKIDKSLKCSMASSFRNFPADINPRLKNRIIKNAKSIYKSLNLRGVVRIDFLFDETKNKIYVCEVNTIPGSLAYYFFNNDKLIINDFVLKLINIAKKYKNTKYNLNKEFLTEILK